MYLRSPFCRYLLLSLLLLAMLLPSVHADLIVPSESQGYEHVKDCHNDHAVHSQHQHSTDCAQSCECATAGYHNNAALSQHSQAATTPPFLNKLMAFSEQAVSQSPGKFERPPRS